MSTNNNEIPVSYGMIGTALVLSILLALYATWASLKLGQLFDGFGAALPFFTELVISYYPLLWLLPLTVVLVAFFHPDRAAKGRVSLIIGLYGSVALFLFITVALYWPINQMGVAAR